MGTGRFNPVTYQKNAQAYASKSRTELFQERKIAKDFDPLAITGRESCASLEHPDPTSIIVACDVTGSMGKIPEALLKGGLGQIMVSLMKIPSISNPQVMFAAIGDMEHDNAPLQVTQFESDNRIEEQLKKLYLEGGGGGNNIESYHCIWYFAAHKARLDSWKKGKKGILFTMGDEMVPDRLKADHIRKFIDKHYQGPDILTSQLVKEVTEKFDVFHLVVQETSTYKDIGEKKMQDCWRQLLGERAIFVPTHTEIPHRIISTVQTLCELTAQASKPSAPVPLEKEGSASVDKVTAQLHTFGILGHKPPASSSASALQPDSDGIPFLYKCPISGEVMADPIIAEDRKTYNRASILKWFETHDTSPMTGAKIGKLIIGNDDLKSEIIRWKEEQSQKQKPAAIVAASATSSAALNSPAATPSPGMK